VIKRPTTIKGWLRFAIRLRFTQLESFTTPTIYFRVKQWRVVEQTLYSFSHGTR